MPTTPTTEEELVHIDLVRSPNGVQMTLRSPIFEEFFRDNAPPGRAFTREQGDSYGGVPYYHLPPRGFPEFISGDVTSWGSRDLLANSRANISVLRAVGIKDGVDITIRAPMSTKQVQEYLRKFNLAAVDFYLRYVRQENFTMQIIRRIASARPA